MFGLGDIEVFDGWINAASDENADNCLTAVRHIFDGTLREPTVFLPFYSISIVQKEGKHVEKPNRAYK